MTYSQVCSYTFVAVSMLVGPGVAVLQKVQFRLHASTGVS